MEPETLINQSLDIKDMLSLEFIGEVDNIYLLKAIIKKFIIKSKDLKGK